MRIPYRQLPSGGIYLFYPQHRNGNTKKSQWTIKTVDEFNACANALSSNWINGSTAWGLYLVNNNALYLGRSADGKKNLFIAKFVDGDKNQQWHGYPADHSVKVCDIPDDDVLHDWMKNKLLKRSKISKIIQGKPCSL